MKEKYIQDKNHWENLKPPLSPNDYEIEIYRHHIKGLKPVCLLGNTKKLVPLCDFMVDLNPNDNLEKEVLKSDWRNFEKFSEVTIGDGVLNLEGQDLVYDLLKFTKKVICRIFLKKLEGMKYAQHFPNSFFDAEMVIPTQENVVIAIWRD
jgi:hypothetical protein